MTLPRLRLRFSDVAATLALVVALSGTAYAVTALPAGSVGTKQLKADAVTGAKLHAGAVHTSDLAAGSVTGSAVRDDSLSLADVKGVNVTGSISFTLNAGGCGNLLMGVGGAVAGQVALVAPTGADWPVAVSAGPARVLTDQVKLPVCNNSGSTVAVTDLAVRIVKFG